MPTGRWSGVGNGFIIDPPYKRIRSRSWAVDESGDAPTLVYVYTEGKTQNAQTDKRLEVLWDSGGISVIANDFRVTWLDED